MLVLLTNNQQREYEDSSILSRLLFCALLCPMFDLLLLTSSLLGTHPIESTSLVRTAAKCFRQRTVVPSTKQPWHDELARTVAGVLVSVFCVTNQFRGYMCGVLVAVRVDRKNDLSSFSEMRSDAVPILFGSLYGLAFTQRRAWWSFVARSAVVWWIEQRKRWCPRDVPNGVRAQVQSDQRIERVP